MHRRLDLHRHEHRAGFDALQLEAEPMIQAGNRWIDGAEHEGLLRCGSALVDLRGVTDVVQLRDTILVDVQLLTRFMNDIQIGSNTHRTCRRGIDVQLAADDHATTDHHQPGHQLAEHHGLAGLLDGVDGVAVYVLLGVEGLVRGTGRLNADLVSHAIGTIRDLRHHEVLLRNGCRWRGDERCGCTVGAACGERDRSECYEGTTGED
ncbi:MAG: hypothetical protein JWO40_455 [Candidatus Doudnabacteria bacterium]|nr:hypothetical protein [Candidatus Doudnabacteria bacterium]